MKAGSVRCCHMKSSPACMPLPKPAPHSSLPHINKRMNHLASSEGDSEIRVLLCSMQQFSHLRQEITLCWDAVLGKSQPVSRAVKGSGCSRNDVIMMGRKQNRTSSSKNSTECNSKCCSWCRSLIGRSKKYTKIHCTNTINSQSCCYRILFYVLCKYYSVLCFNHPEHSSTEVSAQTVMSRRRYKEVLYLSNLHQLQYLSISESWQRDE